MEQLHNLVTGCLVPGNVQDGEDSDDDDGDDDMTWVGYKDVGDLGNGKSLVTFEKTKRIKGELIDLQTGRPRGVAGGFHITDPWWQVTILRTKKNREKLLEPKDYFALCYRLRDDRKRFTDGVVHLFLSKLQGTLTEVDKDSGTKMKIESWFSPARIQFENYLKDRGQYDDFDLLNLKDRLEAYVSSIPEEQRTGSSTYVRFKNAVLQSAEFTQVTVGMEHPELMHYIPQLFPGTFTRIISLPLDKLETLKEVLLEEPGLLAFKPIVSKKCGILGCETSYEALTRSGLLTKVPQYMRDAILMYEYIKKETKEYGHTYVHFSRILDVQGTVIEQFEEALDFLNKNKVTKTLVENGERNVFLMVLWKAENTIASGINSLIKEDDKQPWKLEVDWECDDFESIRQDNDQLRAAKLIACKPVVAISGKGGCGKTYVVTKVITSAKASRQKQADEDEDNENFEDGCHGDASTSCQSDNIGSDCNDTMGDNSEEKEECPEKINLLLTAPTGKAANLLGKRAKSPSYTLHQVIFSYRNRKPEIPWKHKDVNTLVVDECSLVSVSTFSFLIQLLQDQAQLRKVVLLGDVRQLPSIEPGNFLTDTFTSLGRIGCAVELRNNHRAESARIVDNATRISKKMYPEFHPEQFSLLKLPPGYPSASGDDYTAQDISMKVIDLLKHNALKCHITSQFISFTRKVCDSINDLCCKHYSDHRTKEFGKHVFRTGDKICCSKNGYVNLYESHHGIMTCYSQKPESRDTEENSEGGVERTVMLDEDTSIMSTPGNQSVLNGSGNQSVMNGSLNTTAGTSKQNEEPKKPNQIRLCNGEIFFILAELETKDDSGKLKTFLQLSDMDADKEFIFWVDKLQFKKACKIKHAWARTIHTFQGSETDNVVYIVGSASRRQNWQHVYTAVTRGRKSVFIIGREDILRNAIKRSEIKRQTSLRKQLVEKLQKSKDFNSTEILQSSVLNTTAFQPVPSQSTSRKGSNSTVAPPPPVSHDQKNQPMITEFIKSAANTTLNNTLIVRDVLTLLASEHDEDGGSSDIEEIDSDDSQSLFTNIKPASVNKGHYSGSTILPVAMETGCDINRMKSGKSNFHSKCDNKDLGDNFNDNTKTRSNNDNICGNGNYNNANYCGKVRNSQISSEGSVDGVNEVMENGDSEIENDSDPGSDDSQSLISPPTTRSRARVKESEQRDSKNNQRGNVTHSKSGNIESGNGNTGSEIANAFTVIKGKSNRSKLSLAKGKMPLQFLGDRAKTPLNLDPGGRKYRYSVQGVDSPITPVVSRSNFSPNITGAQATSSPFTDTSLDLRCHIRSGMSPLSSGFDESILATSTASASKLFNHSSNRSLTPQSFNQEINKVRQVNELDHIKEPMSNESVQWSEVDESDLLMAADESNLRLQDGGNSPAANHPAVPFILNKQIFKDQRRSLNATNMSVNSQWSEVDDDVYAGFELEDIKNMSDNYHSNQFMNNDHFPIDENRLTAAVTIVNNKSDINLGSKRSISDGIVNHDEDIGENGDVFVPDSPPSPSILETPPKKLKRYQRRNQENDSVASEVSPLKNSLSQLKF